jgi:HNH endonuclease
MKRGGDPKERFKEKFIVSDTNCWLWIASRVKNGYGRFRLGTQTRLAHRVAYELFIGPIPHELTIDHLCRVRHCVNPAHLEAVSMRENLLRSPISLATIFARKTHCPRGHEYTTDNTSVSNGSRNCKACHKELQMRPEWREYHKRYNQAKRHAATQDHL